MDGWITTWRQEKRARSRRRFFFLFLLVFLLLLVGTGWGVANFGWKKIVLKVDGEERALRTWARDVRQLLEEQGITLHPGDEVVPPLATPLAGGMGVEVKRAVEITILADGGEKRLRLLPTTVQEALAQAGIALGPEDRVEPDREKVIGQGDTIRVVRVATRTEVTEEELDYRVVRRPDPQLEKGITRLVQRGQKGIQRTEYRVTYEDGQEVKRELVSQTVLKEPVAEVVAVGTLSEVSRGGHIFRFKRVLWATATAYTHTGWRTATGTVPRVGTVAVDPSVIPLGSRLYIEGYGYGRAEDVGSSIKGDRIDVFLDSEEATRRWGVRRVKVYVLE
ncbi:ubiquitin-like domain-containing protein [Moorellaceae bacterium AZ2]